MNVIVDGKTYEVDESNAEVMGIVHVVSLGEQSLSLLNHIEQCVQAIHSGKTQELREAVVPAEEEAKEKETKTKSKKEK